MIQAKLDLKFYIAADRIMNGFETNPTIKEIVMALVDRNTKVLIIRYLCSMRKYAYYRNSMATFRIVKSLKMLFWHRRWNRLSVKLGFSIGPNSLGYGVVLPHHGTIVVNEKVQIGNFAVLHTSTCIAGGNKVIVDFFYLSSGAQIVGDVLLGDNVSVAAHSLVNSSFEDGNILLVGCPAKVKRTDYPSWALRDGIEFINRVEKVKELKMKIYG